MKANELQIGDWVLDTEFDRNRPDTIECLEPHRVWLTNGKLYQPIDTIKPIPLTKEKLEEIGFEPRNGLFILSDDYYDLHVLEYSDGIWIARFDCCEMNMQSEQLTISYLHELQQFLRHCRIDKTIEL